MPSKSLRKVIEIVDKDPVITDALMAVLNEKAQEDKKLGIRRKVSKIKTESMLTVRPSKASNVSSCVMC